jgi:murein DD-endopeptidase MepM/ murein hydrolase activator NlpD
MIRKPLRSCRVMVVVLSALCAASALADQSLTLQCTGGAVQGGIVLCRTAPSALIVVNGMTRTQSDSRGRATLGVGRDERGTMTVRAEREGALSAPIVLDIAERDFAFSVVGGLDCSKVSVFTPEQLDEIAVATEKKQRAMETFVEGSGAHQGFQAPSEGRRSSVYGARRRLTGVQPGGETCEKTRTHWGLDIAVPEGTPIYAPAPGVVTLADELYFEGNAVFLDHGQGLQSVFMHMSSIDVEPGQRVDAGELLGKVGMTGTATGPHLHWGIKVRNPVSEDRSTDFYVDPVEALALAVSPDESDN